MANITTRASKGAPLSWDEADANFINLNNDLSVHIDDAIDAHVSSAIGYLPAGTGAVATDVQSKLRDVVSVKDFGAVGDGVTDDTAAIQSAFAHAATLLNSVVYFPSGTYLVASSTSLYRLTNGMEVRGDGMNASVIKWNSTYAGSTIALFNGPASGTIDSATIRDLAIEGDHGDFGYVYVSCYPILISSCNNLTVKNVKVTKSKVMGIVVRSAMSVSIDGCVVQYCARDGINTANCNYVQISNNRVEFCDDDGIAGHSQTYDVADRGYVVTGNIVRFAQGIKLFGAKSATISGNTLEFCMAQGISVATVALASAPSEGSSAANGITIVGNTIKNCFDRSTVDGLNSTAPYIHVSSESARAGSLAAIPGQNNPATGTVISPYPYFWTANNASTDQPIADGHNLVICGNMLVRDMYATAKVSDLGFGSFYTRNGPVDPEIVTNSYIEDGILFSVGTFVNALVSSNVVMGIGSGISLGSTAKLIDCKIDSNIFYDLTYGIAVAGDNSTNSKCRISNNIFDLDPHHVASNRGANGTYTTYGDPTALLLESAGGFSIAGNVFRNVNRISDQSVTSATSLTGVKLHLAGQNHIECQPSTNGFSTSNKGIGDVPLGPGFVLLCVDSDPASATFRNTLNGCPLATTVIPTTGTFVKGHVVLNNSPAITGTAGSRYIVQGWVRLTTGSAHVLNTDWAELRCLTGT